MHSFLQTPGNARDTRLALAFVGLSIIWGTTWMAIKVGLDYFSPLLFAGVRSFIAAGATWLIMLATRTPLPRQRREIVPAALMGLIYAPAFALIFWGERFIPSAQAAVINAMTPVFALVVARLWIREPATPRKILGILFGFAGILLIFGSQLSFSGSPASLLGTAALVAAAGFYGFGAVYGKKYLTGLGHLQVILVQMLAAGVALLSMAIFLEEPRFTMTSFQGWVALLYLAVVGFTLAYVLYFFLLGNLSPVQTSYVQVVNPVVAVAVGWLVLRESLTAQALLGAAVVLAGVLTINTDRSRSQALEPQATEPAQP